MRRFSSLTLQVRLRTKDEVHAPVLPNSLRVDRLYLPALPTVVDQVPFVAERFEDRDGFVVQQAIL